MVYRPHWSVDVIYLALCLLKPDIYKQGHGIAWFVRILVQSEGMTSLEK